VRHEFDRFAADFDEQLGKLAYRAPQLLYDIVADSELAARRDLDVLDAGCGTGLCGPLLRPLARRLIGADLSPGMLEQAARRGAYDSLVEAELTAHLLSAAGCYDLIVAADTLVYFGDLRDVLAAASKALTAGGAIAASLEVLNDSADGEAESGFRLNANGRYSHSERYIRRALAEAGFQLLSLRQDVLRNEFAAPVQGFLVLATRRAE
jgi:predicted TPR repeat methyltransferase